MNKQFTNVIKSLFLILLLPICFTGHVIAQSITEPNDPEDLAKMPFTFNMDDEDIDWEGYTFFPFEGAVLERVDNPDPSGLNESDYVLRYQKSSGANWWAGFFYHLESFIEITDETVFRMKVWSPVDDINMMIKLEMQSADIDTGDLLAPLEAGSAQEWIEMEWDLSDVDKFTEWDMVTIIADHDGPQGTGDDQSTWYLDDFRILTSAPTSSELAAQEIPERLILSQNYPNPFNPSTTIDFMVPEASHVMLEVYNMLGQKVATLTDDRLSEGSHSVNFNAADLTSGIYRLQAGDLVQSRHLTLIK